MAIRGRYNDLEKGILEDFEKEADTRQGWYKAPADMPPSMRGNPIITTETLKGYVSRLDPWNPFLESGGIRSGNPLGWPHRSPFLPGALSPGKAC